MPAPVLGSKAEPALLLLLPCWWGMELGPGSFQLCLSCNWKRWCREKWQYCGHSSKLPSLCTAPPWLEAVPVLPRWGGVMAAAWMMQFPAGCPWCSSPELKVALSAQPVGRGLGKVVLAPAQLPASWLWHRCRQHPPCTPLLLLIHLQSHPAGTRSEPDCSSPWFEKVAGLCPSRKTSERQVCLQNGQDVLPDTIQGPKTIKEINMWALAEKNEGVVFSTPALAKCISDC